MRPGGALLLLLWLLPAVAMAKGQLQAGPILLQMAPDQKATRMTLANTGDASLAAQVRVYAWRQENGEDQLVASDAVAASPPIVELAPGAEQVVRLVRLGDAAVGRDQSFRLVVDELPRDDGGGQMKVAVRMRYVLPLFLRAANASPAELTCALDDGDNVLECHNRGGQAAQLGATHLVDQAGSRQQLSAGLFGYVLAGSRRTWALPGDWSALAGKPVRLNTSLNGQPETLPLQH